MVWEGVNHFGWLDPLSLEYTCIPGFKHAVISQILHHKCTLYKYFPLLAFAFCEESNMEPAVSSDSPDILSLNVYRMCLHYLHKPI